MVKISMLSYLAYELNSLVDKGLSIPLKEVKDLCEEKRIFEELERRFDVEGLDLSLMKGEIREEIADSFQDMAVAIDEKRKLLVENNGLCLLIAYALEKISREARR